jgi:3-hydroxyacyl-CoA dehydrogenase/enoyl-CoA hydratase/3-hydroxybutyryl-CoA epimerase
MTATSTSSAATLPTCRHWRVSQDLENIQWWFIDRELEKVNALSREVLEELEALISAAAAAPPRGIVILSGKRSGFIYGADVKEFEGFNDFDAVHQEIQRVHDMFNRLEQLPCTTVAAIEGYCLGGGLELALACDYRIARDTPDTRLGFPEVQLGIFPGFGGSARSVSQIGGLKAMELMLSARQLKARAARQVGLVDELVGRHQSLRWAARRAVIKNRRSRGPGWLARLSNTSPIRAFLAGQMRKRSAQKAREVHYPAPYRLIDTWQRHGGQRQQMMKAEAQAVAELMLTPAAVGLRRVFSLMEKLKSQGRQSPFRARHVHVIGAGVMGGDIAAWCALRGLDVSLQDRELKYVQAAQKRADKLFRKKLRGEQQVRAARQRLRADVDGALLPRADVVIEAIFENTEAKQSLLRELEPRLKPGALLATNTSAIPLETLAEVLSEPQRLIGLHFFNPVARMPLVEVVAGRDSEQAQLDKGAAFCGQINRFPLPVRSSPGFLVNRVLAPYMMEALRMHLEGLPPEAIDAAAEAFGMPMGPVELADTVGLDVCLMVSEVLQQAGSEAETDANNSKTAEFIRQRVDAGKLGKKSGEGIYVWQQDKPRKQAAKSQGHDLDSIAARLIKAYTDECEAALADGIVEDADLLDAGMVFGTGFAPFRGGPLFYLQHRELQYQINQQTTASKGN